VNRVCGVLAVVFAVGFSADGAHAQAGKTGVEKLYVLNCGEGVAGDISRWSPGVNEGKSMDFVDNCYLIQTRTRLVPVGHRDIGLRSRPCRMALAPSDPKAVFWRRPKTLAAQLDQLASRRLTSRHGGLAHPSRPYRECRDVCHHDALRAESRIRMARRQ